jgi:hypothetical protein
MEILYVIVGGALVVAGFYLARLDTRKAKEPEAVETVQDVPEQKMPVPKSGVPMDDQLQSMMSYNPHDALKNGDKT